MKIFNFNKIPNKIYNFKVQKNKTSYNSQNAKLTKSILQKN